MKFTPARAPVRAATWSSMSARYVAEARNPENIASPPAFATDVASSRETTGIAAS